MLLQDHHHLPHDDNDDEEEECRICLQSNPVLITDVCACRSYVHNDCLVLWRTQFARHHIKRQRCEVCLSEYTTYLSASDDDASSDDASSDDASSDDDDGRCMPCLLTMLCLGGVGCGLYVYSVVVHGLAPSPLFLFALASTIVLPLGHGLVESYRHRREFNYGRYAQAVVLLLGGMMMWITIHADDAVAGLFEYLFGIYFVWLMVIILRGCDRRRRW
jgi:hypothetical protein